MEIFNCRLCGGSLQEVLNLGNLRVSGFLETGEPSIPQPLVLVRCTNCDFVQLKHIVDPDLMYRKYWYKSSLNKSMLNSLQHIVNAAMGMVTRNKIKVKTVLDIGCNDGSMLAMYPHKITTVGFDPALNLKDEAKKNCNHFVNSYFTAEAYPFELGKPQIITAIAMFYDLNNPRSFLEDVYDVLDQNGIFIIQMADLVSMLMFNAFDNICHEHAGYYTVPQIIKLLNQSHFIVFKVEHNDVNGGSIRIYAAKKDNAYFYKIDESVQLAIANDTMYLEYYEDPFAAFSMRVTSMGLEMVKVIMDFLATGKRVFAIGASTKGNTLLQYYGLNYPIITAIGEVNEDKFGKRTAGTQIPIIPEQELFDLLDPNDLILVLPWHFKAFFLDKLGSLKSGIEKTNLLIPLPQPELVTITRDDLTVTNLFTGEDIIGWART